MVGSRIATRNPRGAFDTPRGARRGGESFLDQGDVGEILGPSRCPLVLTPPRCLAWWAWRGPRRVRRRGGRRDAAGNDRGVWVRLVPVPVPHEGQQPSLELTGGREVAMPKRAPLDDAEPDLDRVDPGGRLRRVAEVEAPPWRPLRDPLPRDHRDRWALRGHRLPRPNRRRPLRVSPAPRRHPDGPWRVDFASHEIVVRPCRAC